jgi:hypothetical protein
MNENYYIIRAVTFIKIGLAPKYSELKIKP